MRPLPDSDLTSDQPARPNQETSISWSVVAASSRREKSFEGLLLGCAVGDALSLARDGLSRRKALKIFGRSPIQYRFQPGVGVTGERTHGLLMTVQAVLESKADHRSFGRYLRRRLWWYRQAFPIRSAVRNIERFQKLFSDVPVPCGLASDPLVRAIPLGLMLQGNQYVQPWIESSAQASTRQDHAEDASMLIAHAVQLAQMLDPTERILDPISILDQLMTTVSDSDLHSLLEKLRILLAKGASVHQAARSLGWGDGIPPDLYAISTMGIYAWLRHIHRFRFAVERAALLGGKCGSVASVAGALAGASLGKRSIPPEWLKRLSLFPHDKEWRDKLIDRVKDWPHGVEDIQKARAQPSQIIGQIFRNSFYTIFRAIHVAIRIPACIRTYPEQGR